MINEESGKVRRLPGRDKNQPDLFSPAEWERWSLEDPTPGRIIHRLIDTGSIGLYPELAAIVGVPQEPEWHPEGPVHIHTAHVLNAAADIAVREELSPAERQILLFAALTHDLGKAQTTRRRMTRRGLRWTAYGHEAASVPLARRFLARTGVQPELVDVVLPLVEQHMAYRTFSGPEGSLRAARRLAQRLQPASVRQLVLLIEADHSGRPPLPRQIPTAAVRMMEIAERGGFD